MYAKIVNFFRFCRANRKRAGWQPWRYALFFTVLPPIASFISAMFLDLAKGPPSLQVQWLPKWRYERLLQWEMLKDLIPKYIILGVCVGFAVWAFDKFKQRQTRSGDHENV
jgi:hypothetical protein